MSQLIAHRQLRLAAYALATEPGSIQRRLGVIGSRYLESVDLRDAPEYLRNGLTRIKERILQVTSGTQSELLSDAQAVDLAQHILFTYDDLCQMVTVNYYKYVFRLLYAYKRGTEDFEKGNSNGSKYFPRNNPGRFYEPALNAEQKLLLAVYALATGTDALEQRLARAWNEQVEGIDPAEFPEYLRQPFIELRNEISSILSASETADWTTISEQIVQQLASKVFILSEMTTDLFILDYYKYSVTV
jgi:hypothetical protein